MFSLISAKHFAIGIALLMTACLSIVLKPSKLHTNITQQQLEEMVPKQFGEWKLGKTVALVNPLSDVKAQMDETYGAIVSRNYENTQGVNVMLLVAYGNQQTQKIKSHRQEVCYSSQGYAISDRKSTKIAFGDRRIEVTQFFSQRDIRMEPVTYWFTMGTKVVTTKFDRMFTGIIESLTGEIPDGILVRVSNLSSNTEESYVLHDCFIRAMLNAMDNKYLKIFIGK